MNHKIASRCVALIGPLAAAAVALAGCGDAFTLTGGTGGAGATTASVAVSSSSSSSATTSTSTGAMGCNTSQGCPDKQFCVKAGCGDSSDGVCLPVAANHTTFEPVCGCDGVTYWNSILISTTQVAAQKKGKCALADAPITKTCNPAKGCDGGEHCAYERTKCASTLALLGTCWTVPAKCDGTTANELACDNFQNGNCDSLCTLISGDKPFTIPATKCP
jgi:hypothetical protein